MHSPVYIVLLMQSFRLLSSLRFLLQRCAYAAIDVCVMSRNCLRCATALLILFQCTLVSGVFVNFEVQLAISDDQFSPFGTIYGDVEENVSAITAFCSSIGGRCIKHQSPPEQAD